MAHADVARIEARDRGLERRSDSIVEAIQQEPFGKTKAEAGKRARLDWRKFLASHDRVRFGAIGDAARDRSYGIERLAQRKSALGRNALTAWLETDQAT